MTGDRGDPQFVGREGELALAEAALERLSSGEPALIAVGGEAGIGKTRLLDELARSADQRGLLVLRGRASQFQAAQPFAALVDALDDYLQSLPQRHLDELGDEQLTELAQVLPSLDSRQGGSPTGLQDERFRAHLAVRSLLELLAGPQPVVLALDDLHWADQATVELLSNLARRPPRGPVALLLTHRARQLPAMLEGTLAEADRELLHRIELDPLDDQAARALLGPEPDPERVPELIRLSGGNPFYLEELVRAGDSKAGEPDRTSPDDADPPFRVEVPASIAAALERELDGIPASSRQVARGAAIAGETFTPELAAEAAELDQEQVLAAIDELLDRDLLRPTEAPRRFRFRHPIVHGAVYGSCPPGSRLAAHGRVASALEASGASPLERAPHVEASAAAGDTAAIALLTEAGNAASLRAPAAAAHWFGAALGLLGDEDAEQRLGLMVLRAQALGYAGRLEQGRATLDQILVLLDSEDHAVRARVAAAAARVDQLLGRHAEALELLASTLAGLPDQSGPEATELKVQLAGACFFNGDFEGLREWVGQALAEATARGDTATRAAATGSLGAAEYMTGNLDAARARLDEAEGLLSGLDDQDVAGRLHSLVWQGMTEIYLERFDRAEAIFKRGISVARSTGHGHVNLLNRLGQGLVLLWRGRIAEAAELLDTVAEGAMLTGNDQFLAWALWARCRAAILAGDIPEAVRLGERSVASAGPTPDPVSAIAGCYLAEARLEAGEVPTACRDALLSGVGGEQFPLVERGFLPHVMELLVRIELAGDDPEAADRWAERASEAAAGLGLPGRSADAARARAAVALARGSEREAAEAAAEAAALAAAAGLPLEEARARVLAGKALASSDREAAVEELSLARNTLERLGASRYRDQAARELRALGERVARPKRSRAAIGSGVASLSGREEEVANLVAEGHTNKRIAAELFLSEKTVEKHIARIFGKLGVSARAQVAAAVERERVPAGG